MTDFTSEQVREMLIWGAVGGALPTLAKIAGTYGSNFDAPMPNVLGVAVAIALYSLIGAVVARAMGHSEMKQALFAGIAAPAIVVSVLAGASDSNSVRREVARRSDNIGLLSPAFAQNSPPPSAGTRDLVLDIKTLGDYPIEGTVGMYAISDDGSRLPLRLST